MAGVVFLSLMTSQFEFSVREITKRYNRHSKVGQKEDLLKFIQMASEHKIFELTLVNDREFKTSGDDLQYQLDKFGLVEQKRGNFGQIRYTFFSDNSR